MSMCRAGVRTNLQLLERRSQARKPARRTRSRARSEHGRVPLLGAGRATAAAVARARPQCTRGMSSGGSKCEKLFLSDQSIDLGERCRMATCTNSFPANDKGMASEGLWGAGAGKVREGCSGAGSKARVAWR
eukprot:4722950-Prymnesium_polylepis.1